MRTEEQINADIKKLEEQKSLIDKEIQKLEQEKLLLLPIQVNDKIEINGDIGWIDSITTFGSTGNLFTVLWNPAKKDGSRSKNIRQYFSSKDELNKIKKLS